MVTVSETLLREILDRLIRLETEVAATNQRIEDTNRRIEDTNRNVDRVAEGLDRLTGRMDKLFYTMIGLGAAVIAALVAGQITG